MALIDLKLPEDILNHIDGFLRITDYKHYFLKSVLNRGIIDSRPTLYYTFRTRDIDMFGFVKRIERYNSWYNWYHKISTPLKN